MANLSLLRPVRAAGLLGIFLAAFLAACSSEKPPAGRWEGTYESQDKIVAVRLETTSGGLVRISAPDALGIGSVQPEDREVIRERLAEGLASGWDNVAPRKMDFDGKTFRKPGGVAPQMEWNAKTGDMTIYVYFGTQRAIRIPLRAVKDFSAYPFAS